MVSEVFRAAFSLAEVCWRASTRLFHLCGNLWLGLYVEVEVAHEIHVSLVDADVAPYIYKPMLNKPNQT